MKIPPIKCILIILFHFKNLFHNYAYNYIITIDEFHDTRTFIM